MPPTKTGLNLVVAGGGIAASELLLATRALAGHRVRATLISPKTEFEIPALRTVSAFAHTPSPISLHDVVARSGATFCRGTVRRVAAAEHEVILSGGGRLPYDALVLAVGARPMPAYGHEVITYGREPETEDLESVLADVRGGYAHRIAFVVPPRVVWSLPLYEVALHSARVIAASGARAELCFITPEPAPLAVFGHEASVAIARAFEAAEIRVQTAAYAAVDRPGEIRLVPGGAVLEVDRVIALPQLHGPHIHGLPHDDQRFIPIDDAGRVPGLDDVFAIGDATTFPIKQGGIACQLADVVATHLARRAGADVQPEPFRPVLRGQLVSGDDVLQLEHALQGGFGPGHALSGSMWEPSRKVEGRYLSALLEGAPGWTPRETGVTVDVALPAPEVLARHPDALGTAGLSA
ncbi:MAG: hypothetical protein JHC95_01800 [Solirubrobacteraceae bacterium]|nr:hypothetical protein [Solirubrobacteraceae bacterium]